MRRVMRATHIGNSEVDERGTPIVPTLGLFRPEGGPASSAPGFAGTRSEQSGFSADGPAHHVGVNDRAHDQAEHDRMQPLSLMLIGFVGCRLRARPIDRATAPCRCPPAGPLLALLDGLVLFRPSRVGWPCRVGRFRHRSEQSRPRNNRRCSDVGTTTNLGTRCARGCKHLSPLPAFAGALEPAVADAGGRHYPRG